MRVLIHFVRSHQELKKLKSELSHHELLNTIADELTKSARKIRRKVHYTSLPQNQIDFTINNITINSKYSIRSKKAYHSTHLSALFQRKYWWPNNIIDSIWWKPYHDFLSKLSFQRKLLSTSSSTTDSRLIPATTSIIHLEKNDAPNANVIPKMRIILFNASPLNVKTLDQSG
jgi:hypothetical protein